MTIADPIAEHIDETRKLVRSLDKNDVYRWLIDYGYYPESYVVPPCFRVVKSPRRKSYFKVTSSGKYRPDICDIVSVHFPKSELTDRTFGIIDPYIHNDIAYHITANWKKISAMLFHSENTVASYSFPVPIDSRKPGRLGKLRSGRMIYEFLGMVDDDLASMAYNYGVIAMADIKNFYPSIYTHSLAWVIHGKKKIRKGSVRFDYSLVGNKLDKLFQNANGGCTNGIPIGSVVSDIAAEIIASSVDRLYSKALSVKNIQVKTVRFKDDYRILARDEVDAKAAIKILQASLKEYNLELSDAKTSVAKLPGGLFRRWASMYHAVHPYKRKRYSWKQFRELYLSVVEIDRECPETGVIDRFLADMCSKDGYPKVAVGIGNLQKVISMFLMLGTLRVKAFPKIIAILESILRSPFGRIHEKAILEYLIGYLKDLSVDEDRNKYSISWISYFLISNGFKKDVTFAPAFKDPIVRSIYNNRGLLFRSRSEFKLFEGCIAMRKRVSMIDHLDIFNPPKGI